VELTAITDPPKPFQIEATLMRPGDDDPTKLMVRESNQPKGDSTSLGFGAAKWPAPDIKPSGPRDAVDSAADTKADPSVIQRVEAQHKQPRAGRGLIIASVILLLLSAGAAALYFSGMLG
jgi:hypothetical protein